MVAQALIQIQRDDVEHACVMYCIERTPIRETGDENVFLAHGHGNISVKLLSIEGLKALKQKHLNLCSDDERRTYGFGKTSG